MNVYIRDALPIDISFVYNSWLRSLRPHSPVDRLLFFAGQHSLIEAILTQPKVTTSILCLEESPEVIIGWCVWELGLVHYIYIKQDFRNMGYANQLLDNVKPRTADQVIYTHFTPAVKYFERRNPIYNPYELHR